MVVSPSKITVEKSTKEPASTAAGKKDTTDCEYSSSPIRWSFLAGSESKTPSDDLGRGATGMTSHDESDSMRKYTDYSGESHESQSSTLSRTESNTVVFHQEGEAANNCCNNYLQYNAYLDQDLQITSEDICGYLSLSKDKEGEILNNSVSYPFQPTNALEFQYRKNFHAPNSDSPETNYQNQQHRINSKETNLNQNFSETIALSPTNINLSSSSNNINIIFNSYGDNNAGEVKFINTTRESSAGVENQQSSFIHQRSYPSYEYNNMSANSLFDKPLGIDEIPSASTNPQTSTATTPENFFESTSSSQNLLYCRYSSYRECQSNSSSFSNANSNFNNSGAAFDSAQQQDEHADHQCECHQGHQQQHYQQQSQQHQHHPHHHRHCAATHRWQHVTENFKIGNALKLVRKRARKCAQYLRKK
ncbi:unnamed protein product [Hermetia illucens]|uniref:Uncharacterized protein n=1 Tax=Hermetia illucens TaxID=343691 RepID=A0A7R8UJS3_HERIL|nr:unnamed protein product [Hermetia illucens]